MENKNYKKKPESKNKQQPRTKRIYDFKEARNKNMRMEIKIKKK